METGSQLTDFVDVVSVPGAHSVFAFVAVCLAVLIVRFVSHGARETFSPILYAESLETSRQSVICTLLNSSIRAEGVDSFGNGSASFVDVTSDVLVGFTSYPPIYKR